MDAGWPNAWLPIALLLVVSVASAGLLRWAGLGKREGAWLTGPMLGGILAGVLLGPSIFGRAFPLSYERIFEDGVTERTARDSLVRRHGAEMLAAERAGLQRESIADMRDQHTKAQTDADHILSNARWQHQAPLRVFTLVLVGVALLASCFYSIQQGDRRQGLIAPLSIGMWSAAFPAALAYAAMIWWWGYAPAQAALVAAASAIGPWAITPDDQRIADQAELGGARMVQTAGRVASALAIVLAAWSMWAQRGTEGLLLALPLACLPLAWLLSALFPSMFARESALKRIALGAFAHVVIPTLAACASIKIDLFNHLAVWPILFMLLMADDGRWVGAMLGATLLGGRGGLRTVRLIMGAMAAGPTQLALTAWAAQTWSAPPELLLALVAGALLIELTAPARHRLAHQLMMTEQHPEDLFPD